MSIIEVTTEDKTQAEKVTRIKGSMVKLASGIYRQTVMLHTRLFNQLWKNPKASPQEILDEYGTEAAQLFSFSSQLQAMALGINPAYEPLVSPYEFTINSDGTVTVGDKIKT
jgi:hypothetical protein